MPRAAHRRCAPRWESSSDPADEDDLIEFAGHDHRRRRCSTLDLFLGVVEPAAFVDLRPRAARVLGSAGVGVYSWIVARHMPPGGAPRDRPRLR